MQVAGWKGAPSARPLTPKTMPGSRTYGGHSIAVFDKNGKPLTPPDGITFDGRLGRDRRASSPRPAAMCGLSGPRRASWSSFPKGDLTTGRIVCEGSSDEPCKSFLGPFHLGIDQQNRIWVTNAFSDHVTRFPADDPSKSEKFIPVRAPADLASTARATFGSPTGSAMGFWAGSIWRTWMYMRSSRVLCRRWTT